MWCIRLLDDVPPYSYPYDYMGHQMYEKNIEILDSNINHREDMDYKRLNRVLEEHIFLHINTMRSRMIELYVYNYGFDNAIALLNNYNIKKNPQNTTSKSLLFAIFYNRFSIYYIPSAESYTANYKCYYQSTIIIQRFWRKILKYRTKMKKNTIDKEISYLIVKINNEIVGESTKNVLIYMVNKFRMRISKTMRL